MLGAFSLSNNVLHSIIKAGAGSSQFTNLSLNDLAKITDNSLLQTEFERITAPVTINQWQAGLQRLIGERDTPARELLSKPNLLIHKKIARPIHAGAHTLVPLLKGQLPVLEKHIIALHKRVGGKPGDVVWLTQPGEDVKHTLGHNFMCHLATKKLSPLKAPAYIRDKVEKIGKQYYEIIDFYYTQCKENAAHITCLITSPEVLSAFALHVAQKERRFVRLTDILPQLGHIILLGGGLQRVYQTEQRAFLAGSTVKISTLLAWPEGITLYQTDPNVGDRFSLAPVPGLYIEGVNQKEILPNGEFKRGATRHPIATWEKGNTYEVVVSHIEGLLAVKTQCLMQVVTVNPLQLKYVGNSRRLNSFGENLSEGAIAEQVGLINDQINNQHNSLFVRDYMVGAKRISQRHMWVFEVSRPLSDISAELLSTIAHRLNTELENAHEMYRKAIRNGNMLPPLVYFVPLGTIQSVNYALCGQHIDYTQDAHIINQVIVKAWQHEYVDCTHI